MSYLNQKYYLTHLLKTVTEVDTLFYVAVFPRLDALPVLDASAHFDAGWSGRNTF